MMEALFHSLRDEDNTNHVVAHPTLISLSLFTDSLLIS
jgi:hypothetical protein